MQSDDDLKRFVEQIASDPTVQAHFRWVRDTYDANPGKITIERTPDGNVITWSGGPIAIVADVYYQDLFDKCEAGELGFEFGCVMVTPGCRCLLRHDDKEADRG